MQEWQLHRIGYGLDLFVDTADVFIAHVGYLFENEILDLDLRQLLESKVGPAVDEERVAGFQLRTDELIAQARAGPAHIRDRGLRLETAVITAIAERLSAKLRRRDPIAVRVELNTVEKILCLVTGIARGLMAR